jgi:hypothetical protein
MGLKSLAEGIIVQSMEDLWDESLREDCILFFRSEEFRICAELAGIGLPEQLRLLDMVKEVLDCRRTKKSLENGRNSNSNKMKTYQKWGTKEMVPCR